MHIVADVRNTEERFENVILTIGCFDGVHLGHQQILKTLVQEAAAIKGTPAVMTLEPHPRQFFSPQNAPNILTTTPIKYRLLKSCGVEVLYVLPFDAGTVALSPQQFLESIIVDRCHAVRIVVGHDFAFGDNAAGDYDFLTSAADAYGFKVLQVPPFIIGGQRVSSTLIRERVIQGEVDNLKEFLGRNFSLYGSITPGRGIGRSLGFPTANLDIGPGVVPAHGVYAAEAIVNGTSHPAAVNIGIAPTIRDEQPLVEAHLIDFSGTLGPAKMELVLHKRLRPEKKFASHHDLIKAIAADVQYVREYFKRVT